MPIATTATTTTPRMPPSWSRRLRRAACAASRLLERLALGAGLLALFLA